MFSFISSTESQSLSLVQRPFLQMTLPFRTNKNRYFSTYGMYSDSSVQYSHNIPTICLIRSPKCLSQQLPPCLFIAHVIPTVLSLHPAASFQSKHNCTPILSISIPIRSCLLILRPSNILVTEKTAHAPCCSLLHGQVFVVSHLRICAMSDRFKHISCSRVQQEFFLAPQVLTYKKGGKMAG